MKIKPVLFTAILIFYSFVFSLYAQNDKLQLIDDTSLELITGASFRYGSQNGLSDQEGFIRIRYGATDTLYLSHINYGKWSLTPVEVAEALQEGVVFRSPEFKSIHPVRVIAMRSRPGSSKSIEFDPLDKLSHDGGWVLAQTPLIGTIRKSPGYGLDPVLRGFKYEQLNLVIDGGPCAIAACPNRMDPPSSQVAPNMMARVEIFKGPHTLRYGNSFGGTVNFISEKPRFTEHPKAYGRVSGAWESNGNILRTEGMSGIRTKKADAGIYASWSQGADYKDGAGNRVPASFHRGSLGSNIAIGLTKKQVLSLSATRNFARDVIFPALPMDLRSDDTWLLNAKHTVVFDKRRLASWQTHVFGNFVQHFMDNRLKDSPPMEAETRANTKSYGGRTEGVWQFSRAKLYGGMDFRMEQATGVRKRFMPNGNVMEDNAWQDASISKTGLFGEYQYVLQQNKFVLSARMELNRATSSDVSPEFAGIYPETGHISLNPAISLGGVHSTSGGFSAGLWLGSVSRSAGITERYINFFPVGLDPYEMLGNPMLKPEINNQADLVLSYKSDKLTAELDLFFSWLQDFISSEIDTSLDTRLPNSPGVRQYRNLDKALLTGFECRISQLLFWGLDHQLNLAFTYGENKVDNTPLPEIAPLDIHYILAGHYLQGRLIPELTLRYAAGQSRIAESFGETETPSFLLVNLEVSYRILKGLQFTAALLNLFDTLYYEHLTRSVRGTTDPVYAQGRSFNFSLSYAFNQ